METAKVKKKSSSKAKKSASVESIPRSGPAKGLVIVESPAKAKTLKKYLGRNFDVKASVGHILDLPKSSLGVDLDHDFTPTYELIKGKTKVVEELKKAALNANKIYLAADPDREGEAIAWHIVEVLKLPEDQAHRVLFHEITKPAVLKAIENPVAMSRERYESQQARRVLDRLVGYKISPLLWTKVRRGLSAGRVQSVAVRMIVEREKEVLAFQPKAYWTIESLLEADGKNFPARLIKVADKKIERTDIDSEEWAKEIVQDSASAQWKITGVTQKQRRRNPDPPFITSTLQQEASKRLYFSAKKTMTLAQQLYEGVELGDLGAQGLITYMRTDSTRLSDEAIKNAREIIQRILGDEYLPKTPLEYRNKKNAQDAHEAVRPTSVEFTPEIVKPYLDVDQYRLYELIWKRYLASQMEQAVFDQTSVDIEATAKNGKVYGYRANGSILRFDGFLVMWQSDEKSPEETDSVNLPDLTEKTRLAKKGVKDEKHFTQPPPRYSESSLIKELEEKGIGRPSTYASILSTIQDRKYVEKKENRFYPTELGNIVTELLIQSFAEILDVKFTANLEDQLDQIEEGKLNWIKTLKDFYTPFEKELATASEKMRNIKREETVTELKCPKCEKPVILKWGKNGKFAACQGYPDCRFTSEYTLDDDGKVKLVEQQVTDEKCPACSAPMAIKTGRFGKFLACSSYPTCKTTKAITTGIECPECKKGELSEKRTRFGKVFYSCTQYPNCKYAMWDKPIKGRACPECQHPFLAEHYTKKEGASIRCPNKECGFVEKVESSGSPS
ncbi:MAG: type I DNA topoisomerase [Proteobacteria bacterium]|nr:type I DNA topoisomerase [Pseudomonadota bacterium]